jgi:dTMP kinase
MERGRFITFEGGEGSGKSTQAWLLSERLAAHAVPVRTTREPGGSTFAEHVRALLLSAQSAPKGALAEALLFNAARADHLDETIRPALAGGTWVICDRFADSTRVYQGAAGGLDGSIIDTLETIVLAETRPDLTFVLDIDPVVGLARARERRNALASASSDGEDPYEARQLAFHRQLRAGFLAVASADPQRVVVVDGALSQEAIADVIWRTAAARLAIV